jgi:hypothetical protein
MRLLMRNLASTTTSNTFRHGVSAQSSTKKSKLDVREAVADILCGADLEAEPIGHHPQTAPQLRVALFDMVSNFAAFKCREQGVGDPSPGYRLPIPQLMYLAA